METGRTTFTYARSLTHSDWAGNRQRSRECLHTSNTFRFLVRLILIFLLCFLNFLLHILTSGRLLVSPLCHWWGLVSFLGRLFCSRRRMRCNQECPKTCEDHEAQCKTFKHGESLQGRRELSNKKNSMSTGSEGGQCVDSDGVLTGATSGVGEKGATCEEVVSSELGADREGRRSKFQLLQILTRFMAFPLVALFPLVSHVTRS